MKESIGNEYMRKNAIDERQAIDAFYQRTLEHIEINGEYQDVITDKYSDAEDIVIVERLTKRLAKSEGMLFTKRIPKMPGVRPYIHAKDAGKDFLNALKIDFESIEKRFALHSANYFYDTFTRNVREYDYSTLALRGTRYAPEEIDGVLEILNGMIDKIRAEVNTKEFKEKIKKLQRTSNKALAGAREYIDRHFDNCSVLCNIRVDLYLNKNNYFACELENEPVSSKESIEFIDAFIAGMEVKKVSGYLFEHCLGYVIKREYGLERGYHFHAIIFFNGHRVQADIQYAKMIGEYWARITGGIGTYFNCNLSKSEYKHCGIGKIHYADMDMRKGIDKALIYMTKPDYYIRLVSEGERNFRRGTMPPLKNNAGRPRLT